MDKNELISTLREAARSHKKWVSNALALIEGVPLDKGQVPLNSTECEFGKWYYGQGQNLRDIYLFKEIEKVHDDLHKIYLEIFALLFGEVQGGTSFFSRLFGRSHNTAVENRQRAMDKFRLLEEKSNVIAKQLVQLEKVVSAMGDKQLEKYLGE